MACRTKIPLKSLPEIQKSKQKFSWRKIGKKFSVFSVIKKFRKNLNLGYENVWNHETFSPNMVPFQWARKHTILPFFGTLTPHVTPQRGPNGVNRTSMYFRHHSIEIYAKDFLKLDYSFWTNDCPLAEPCVKKISTVYIIFWIR